MRTDLATRASGDAVIDELLELGRLLTGCELAVVYGVTGGEPATIRQVGGLNPPLELNRELLRRAADAPGTQRSEGPGAEAMIITPLTSRAGDKAALMLADRRPFGAAHRRIEIVPALATLIGQAVSHSSLDAEGENTLAVLRALGAEVRRVSHMDDESTFNNMGVAAATLSRRGEVLRMNRALTELTGFSPSELTNTAALGVDRWINNPTSRDALEGALIAAVSGGEGRFEGPAVFAGHDRWLRIVMRPVRDGAGQVDHVVATVVDITDRRHAEELLEVSQRLAALGSWRIDPTRVEATAELRRILGIERPLGRRDLQAMVHPDDRDLVAAALEQSATEQRLWNLRLRMIRAVDGETIFVESRGQAGFGQGGRIDRSWGIVQDITERVAAEAALREAEAAARSAELGRQLVRAQRLESVGKLAGGIAHDFNNLLAVIINYAGFIESGLGPDQQSLRGDLGQITSAANRGAELTRRLLLFGRGQLSTAGRCKPNEVIADLGEILRATLDRDIELVVALAEGTPDVGVSGDELEQVLVALVVNAQEAMESGGRLRIETRRDTEFVRIRVIDNGAGMSEPVLEHALEPFFTTKTFGEGSGLGLSTVHGIVHRAGGTIDLRSEPGEGVTVTIMLPAATGETTVAAAEQAGAVGSRAATILVVEDQPAIRAAARRILESSGHSVLEAADGDEARSVAAGESIDLLLTDVVMAGTSGPELAEALRAEHHDLRLLFMSGHTGEVLRTRVGELEAEVLSKPFTAAGLLAAIDDALG